MIVRGLKQTRLAFQGGGYCSRDLCPCAVRDVLGGGGFTDESAAQAMHRQLGRTPAQGLLQPDGSRDESVNGVSEAGDRRRHACSR